MSYKTRPDAWSVADLRAYAELESSRSTELAIIASRLVSSQPLHFGQTD